jgi:thioredoxin-like negative regulator of GroEL
MRLHLLLPLLLLGCATTTHPAVPPLASPPAPAGPPVPFIEDDYPGALAQAKATGRPLFVDAWAPWCHSCQSMRAFVFTDERLRPVSGRFVWLAVNTEKADNASFVEHFPMDSWPTLWVVDPKSEQPVLKWAGSATAPELASLLEDASTGASGGTDDAEAMAALLRGERAVATGKSDEAIRELKAALLVAPPKWARRGRADEALISALWAAKDDSACANLADSEMAKLPAGTSLANVGLLGLQCARRAPAGSEARALAPRLGRAVEQIALDPSVPILDDDRSGLFEEVVDDRSESHDDAGARSLAATWATGLEARAAAAKTPSARAVFDAHRTLAYVALGDPGRALPMLSQSEHDLPDDYNPPARLARVYLELKRYDEGLAAIGRALAKGYGPRKLRLYLLEADILQGKGDAAGVKRALDEAAVFATGLPPAERPPSVVQQIDKRRAALPR